MTTTFVNQNTENNIEELGLKALKSRQEDLIFFEYFDADDEDEFLSRLEDNWREIDDLNKLKEVINQYDQIGRFSDYGLSFDKVDPGTFDDQKEGFFRFQISWGGPSEEVRFFRDRTEFVFMDWFCGVGFDVSNEDGFQWLRGFFEGCAMMDFDSFEYYEDEEE